MSITTTAGIPPYIATATVPDLTTIFTPPASCLNRWVAAGSSDFAWSTYSRDGYKPPTDSIYYSCLPRNLRGPHYSPGVCTDGQTIAGMTKYEESSRTMWQAQCCKSGMTIKVETIQSSPVPMCVSAISTPLPVHALFTTTYANGDITSMYEFAPNDQSTKSNMTTMTRGTAVADPLYVAFEEKDLSLFPVAYATNLAQKIGVSFTPTATPGSGSGSGPSETGSSNNNDSAGLSNGAKIGIGVGAGVGGLLVAALIGMFFILRRLRKNSKSIVDNDDGYAPPEMQHHELENHDMEYHEMDHGGVAAAAKGKWGHRQGEEAAGAEPVAVNELDSRPVHIPPPPPVELDGSCIPGPR